MAQPQGEAVVDSETRERAIQAASYLLGQAFALQAWSGSLDWSKRLVNNGVLTQPELISSFSAVSRRDFLPESEKPDEGYDHPIGIGYGQTNSQPTMVAQMLELLKPRRGHSVLDVGTGSGWTTALLASAVGKTGQVIGVEKVPQLVDFGRENLARYNFSNAKIELAGDDLGMSAEGPYHRILVLAHMLEAWMPELTNQLNPRGGVMVAPIATEANHGSRGYNQSIAVVTRHGAKFAATTAMEGVGFVPLVHESVN